MTDPLLAPSNLLYKASLKKATEQLGIWPGLYKVLQL